MTKMLIKGWFCVNEREEAKGRNVDLDKAKFAFFVGGVPNDGELSARQVIVYLWSVQELDAHGS